jgi:GNAT superfamily N-acetyltransferase
MMTALRLPLRCLSSTEGWTEEFDRHFRGFHDRVYCPAFPDPDIRDTAANLKRVADIRHFGAQEPWGFIDFALAPHGNREIAVGGIFYELYRASDAALVSYIAVAESHRRRGVAGMLFRLAGEQLRAQRRGGRPLLIFAETEMEEHGRKANARLAALARLGFALLDFDYVQPPLGPGKNHVRSLDLLVYRAPGDVSAQVPAERIAHFLTVFYRTLMGQALAGDAILQQVLADLARRDTVAVEPLSPG